MIDILEIEVSTAIDEGRQVLIVKADIGRSKPETFFFIRPFGANAWFSFIGRGRRGSVDRNPDSTRKVVDEIEEMLIRNGWPVRPISNSLDSPDTGTVKVQFSDGREHTYPLFAQDASVVVAKRDDIEDSNIDATVKVEYSDNEYEYAIHRIDGELPDDWILKDLIIWADAVELGDTYHSHDDLREPKSITVHDI